MAKHVLVALFLASQTTCCWGARVHADTSGGYHSLTNSSHFSLWENVITNRIKHELEFKAEPPKVNKILWVLFTMAFGLCGCDRCFMGQICLGVIKGLTFGGLLVWQLIDYFVCAVNAIQMEKEVKAVGYDVAFEENSIQFAQYLAGFFLLCLLIHICLFANNTRKQYAIQQSVQKQIFEDLQKAQNAPTDAASSSPVLTRHQSLPYLPTRLTAGLRSAGMIAAKPTIPELIALFDKLDTNNDGHLDRQELTDGLKELGTSDESVDEMLKDADTNKDGKISKDEWLVHLAQEAKK